MIDMHCHLLFGVDDGAQTLSDSIAMLDVARQQGITDMILTPHYRHGMFAFPLDEVRLNFAQLVPEADKRGIRLFLGCEYHVNSRMIEYLDAGRCLTLADSEYVLAEYSYDTPYRYIKDTVMELLMHGYIPVVAHVERYECFIKEPLLTGELSHMGAWIQVDANAVLGMEGRAGKKCAHTLLKHGMADIIASDCHDVKRRGIHMKECYQLVAKKYTEQTARAVFDATPKRLLSER